MTSADYHATLQATTGSSGRAAFMHARTGTCMSGHKKGCPSPVALLRKELYIMIIAMSSPFA
jgi:hypothetical protein